MSRPYRPVPARKRRGSSRYADEDPEVARLFHRLLAVFLGDESHWRLWNNLWTAEEDRHGQVLHDYARDTRLFDQRFAAEASLAWSGTFAEYYDQVVENPALARLSHARVYEMLMAAGAEDIQITREWLPEGWSIHEIGTTRMGDDAKTSVTDRHCRLHDVQNVYLADGAPFVSGGTQNTTWSILAIAA